MTSVARRIAITGASGYLAGRLIQRLEGNAEVEHILALDIRSLGQAVGPKLTFVRHDVSKPMGSLFADNDIDTVVHLAFILNPGHDREAIRKVNVGGTANVLQACEGTRVRQLLYLSSTSVYGAHADNQEFLTEESPPRPVKGFQYSEDKAQAESLIAGFTEQHPSVVGTILRVCPVMGPNADNFISRAYSKPFLVGVRGYNPPLQFFHEDDLVDLILLCLAKRPSGVYNVAGDGTISWEDAVRSHGRKLLSFPAALLYGLTDLAWKLRLQKDSPACGLDMIRYPWLASTEKIKNELGVEFQHTSREAWESFTSKGGPSKHREAKS